MPFLYLTTKGWKSGRPHEIEIWFVERGSNFYVVSEMREKSHWVQKIKRSPEVSFRVGDATYEGSARAVDRKAEPELARDVSRLMEKAYKWSDGLIVEVSRSRGIGR